MNGNKGTIGGSIVALVTAAIGLAVAFGANLSPAERDAIVAFVTAAIAVAPIVGAVLDHSRKESQSRVDAATIANESRVQAAAMSAGSNVLDKPPPGA